MLFQHVILLCSESLLKERSPSSVYHLLKGRKSIQTVLDYKIFNLNDYYGIYPWLKRQAFEKELKALLNKGFLHKKGEYIHVTDKGFKQIHDGKELYKEVFFKGHLYEAIQTPFYLRLLLMTQVWTNKKMNNSSYMAVVDNRKIEDWVKRHYMATRHKVSAYLQKLHDELYQIFEKVSEREAHLFIDRMTSFNHYGLSIEQLSKEYNLSSHDVHLYLQALVHRLIYEAKDDKATYPLLYSFLDGLETSKLLAQSAQKTEHLFKQGYGVNDIAGIRKLSPGTIQDHMVEIALHRDDFPYDTFVSRDMIKNVLSVVTQLNTYKLKDIKEELQDDISYFQIRLILTQINRGG